VLRELQFNGEVVVVTGASTGIGRSTAGACRARATTVLVARTQSKLDEVKAAIAKNGGTAETFVADVGNEAEVGKLRELVAGRWGRVKALINNAGNNFISPVTELATEKWRELIAVDLDSVYYMCRDFIPLLLNQQALHPQRRLHVRAYRQRADAGLPRGQGRRRFLTRQLAVDYGPRACG
jgi:NAD(P)-dependent dehydrogenase (short-subunit alcohol dehydrogenase family)